MMHLERYKEKIEERGKKEKAYPKKTKEGENWWLKWKEIEFEEYTCMSLKSKNHNQQNPLARI